MRMLIVVGLVAMVSATLYVAAGGFGNAAKTLGSTLTGFVQKVTATATPSPTVLTIGDPPTIASPAEPYTNAGSVDLVVTVPSVLAGNAAYRLRVYLQLQDQAPAAIQETPIGPSARTVIPVTLSKGINDFTVTLIGPGGESESSALVRYVLDQVPPPIKLTSPKDGATVNRSAVMLQGRTQGRSTLIVRNAANGSSIVGTADGDGAFSLSLPLAAGSNTLRILATDPAGNEKELALTLRRGTGKLTASLSASVYRIRRADLPRSLRLTVTVLDPDGALLPAAQVTFTLSIPGVAPITSQAVTGANGRAVWTTTIPAGAEVGSGNAAALVTAGAFGTVSDEAPVDILK